MKINGLKKKALWENLTCKCNHDDIEQCYPIIKCNHCKFQQCWDSVPQKNFTINEFDTKGKKTGTKTIKEITLVRGSIEDIIGWTF
tara:strand:+ start:266 stop:523 length:258 start_codon:yes stop_codon:yes gene_type:complete